MTDLHWSPEEFEWVAQVRQVLLDLARACLGDAPTVPLHLAQVATPTAERAKQLLDAARDRGIADDDRAQYAALQWTESVRSLCIELAEMYLSDRPALPENLSERALDLASSAQTLIDKAQSFSSQAIGTTASSTSITSSLGESTLPVVLPSPTLTHQVGMSAVPSEARSLMQTLYRSLKREWADSPRDAAPEWEQMLTLLEVMQSLYDRL